MHRRQEAARRYEEEQKHQNQVVDEDALWPPTPNRHSHVINKS